MIFPAVFLESSLVPVLSCMCDFCINRLSCVSFREFLSSIVFNIKKFTNYIFGYVTFGGSGGISCPEFTRQDLPCQTRTKIISLEMEICKEIC